MKIKAPSSHVWKHILCSIRCCLVSADKTQIVLRVNVYFLKFTKHFLLNLIQNVTKFERFLFSIQIFSSGILCQVRTYIRSLASAVEEKYSYFASISGETWQRLKDHTVLFLSMTVPTEFNFVIKLGTDNNTDSLTRSQTSTALGY